MNLYESIKSNLKYKYPSSHIYEYYSSEKEAKEVADELEREGKYVVDEIFPSGEEFGIWVHSKEDEDVCKRKWGIKESDSSFDVEGLADRIDILSSELDPYEYADVYGTYDTTEESYQNVLSDLYNKPESVLSSLESYEIIDWEDDIQTEYNEVIQDLKKWISISRSKNESEDSSKKGYSVTIKMKNNKQVIHLFNTEEEMYEYLNLLSHYVGQGEVEILDYTGKKSKKNESVDNPYAPTAEDWEDINHWYNDNYEEMWDNQAKHSQLSSEDIEWLSNQNHVTPLTEISMNYHATGDIETDERRLNDLATTYFYDKVGIYNQNIDGLCNRWAHDQAVKINEAESLSDDDLYTKGTYKIVITTNVSKGDVEIDSEDTYRTANARPIDTIVKEYYTNALPTGDSRWKECVEKNWNIMAFPFIPHHITCYTDSECTNEVGLLDDVADKQWREVDDKYPDNYWKGISYDISQGVKLYDLDGNQVVGLKESSSNLNPMMSKDELDDAILNNKSFDLDSFKKHHGVDDTTPEGIVYDSYYSVVNEQGKEPTIDNIIEDILYNYTQDYFKDNTPEESKETYDSIRYFLRKLGLSYNDLDESENESFQSNNVYVDYGGYSIYSQLDTNGKDLYCEVHTKDSDGDVDVENLIDYFVLHHEDFNNASEKDIEKAMLDHVKSNIKYYKKNESDENEGENSNYKVDTSNLFLTNNGYHNNSDIVFGRIKLLPKDKDSSLMPGHFDLIYFCETGDLLLFKLGTDVRTAVKYLYNYGSDDYDWVEWNGSRIKIDTIYETLFNEKLINVPKEQLNSIESAITNAYYNEEPFPLNKVNYD